VTRPVTDRGRSGLPQVSSRRQKVRGGASKNRTYDLSIISAAL
jgi:hypothetical protein